MIAFDVAHRHRLDPRLDPPSRSARRPACSGKRVATPLALEHQREGRIATDPDPRDGIHLESNLHACSLSRLGRSMPLVSAIRLPPEVPYPAADGGRQWP